MRNLLTKVTYLLILLFALNGIASAQISTSKIELGINALLFIYQGDLTPSKFGSYRTLNPGLGIFGDYKVNHSIYLRTALAHGKLKGDDSKYSTPAWRQQRNFKFQTPVTEISESVIWNITRTSNDGGRRFSPYISAGVAYTFLHIRRDYSNYNSAYFVQDATINPGLAADIAHPLPRRLLVFPVGAGLRYAITKNISLNTESGYRFNSSDYLDGFSQAANPDKKDHYFTHAIGLIFNFDKNNTPLKCPTVPH
jgi:Opacity protein and related surface antigens